ncbi:MAG: nucleotidyltransferase domain-containing protein [Acidaminococcaceae bacterium]|nr:nucleotidyltransferase domain-containing protein [Acidaminococcaceae bacterium]MBQ9698054.1 nucleotidyltransferase domain-containing protein [Acidaminococcaceae bacterium]MBR1590457.1 nucleotidyltransferase domain-containing protein [Acidaminococcaceae bacterium]
MTGIESLSKIKDSEYIDNIKEMTQCFVSQIKPLKVILFGSFANGTYTDESDYDFYIVIPDGSSVSDATDEAYNSVLYIKKRSVDIVVGTNSRFEMRGKSKHSLMVEGEVQRNGILLYDRMDCIDSQRGVRA